MAPPSCGQAAFIVRSESWSCPFSQVPRFLGVAAVSRVNATWSARQQVSLEEFGYRAGVPAVAGAGSLDQLADGEESGGEVQAEVHDPGVALGAAVQLAVSVHPGVGSALPPGG